MSITKNGSNRRFKTYLYAENKMKKNRIVPVGTSSVGEASGPSQSSELRWDNEPIAVVGIGLRLPGASSPRVLATYIG